MDKYCYISISVDNAKLNESNTDIFRWSVMLFKNVKIKKGCGQLAEVELKGNWNYDSYELAVKSAKKVLKTLGVRKAKDSKNGWIYRRNK